MSESLRGHGGTSARVAENEAATETETVGVEVTVEDLWSESDGRRLVGLARVRLAIAGVEVRISGVRISRARSGRGLYAELPMHPSTARGWARAVALPPELERAVLRAVLQAAGKAGLR